MPVRARTWTGLFALFFAALVFGISILQVRSPDLYWHIKMGSDWLFKGLSPFVDHYSFTVPGHPIMYVPWGFQVVISLLYRAFGLVGIGIYRFVAFSLALFVLDRTMVRSGVTGGIRALTLGTCVIGFVLHAEPRPELGSLPLEALFVWLFLKWREQRSFRALVLPLVLLVVWINYHSTGVIGLVIAFAFLAEAGLDDILAGRYRHALIAAGYAALFFFASFLHHELSSPALQVLKFDPRWAGIIQEYEVRAFADYELPLRMYWVFMALSLPALFARRQWAGVLLLIVSGYQSVRMYKFTSHMLVLTAPFVALSFQYYWNEIGTRGNARARRLFAGAVAAAAAVVMLSDVYWVYFSGGPPRNLTTDDHFFPARLVKYMKDRGVRGRVFNHYDWGGYLFFNFDQDIKVFIDPRTNILYDIDLFQEWLRMATAGDAMKAGAEKYRFDYIVSRPDELLINESAIASGTFGLDYADSDGALFVRGRGRFPETQRYLYHPRCLDDDAMKKSVAEYAAAHAALPADSPVVQYLTLLSTYASTQDKAGLFKTLSWASSSITARLASELAYRAGDRNASLAYLNAMRIRGVDDQIMIVRLLIESGRPDIAAGVLERLLHRSGIRGDQEAETAALDRTIRGDAPLKPMNAAICRSLAQIY